MSTDCKLTIKQCYIDRNTALQAPVNLKKTKNIIFPKEGKKSFLQYFKSCCERRYYVYNVLKLHFCCDTILHINITVKTTKKVTKPV